MKSIVLEKTGGPEQLKSAEFPTPEPKNNEVLVRVKAAGLNHVDIWVRSGSPAYPVSLPHIPGVDGAGIVEKMGPDAEGVSVGDRVVILPGLFCGTCAYCTNGMDNQCDTFEILGAKRAGTFAEFVAVPDQNVIPLPSEIDFETAAAYPVAYLTAWHMLFGKARLEKKETILVVGAGGGVSMAALQLAKWKGATVLASTTSPGKVEKIKTAGASDVFVQEQGKELSAWVKEKTGGKGVDVVFENVGPATWDQSFKSLKKYGRLVTCGSTTGPSVPLELRLLFGRDISIFGARLGTQKEFQELSNLIFSGKIKPVIDITLPMEKAAEAHQHMEDKKQAGKIVLTGFNS